MATNQTELDRVTYSESRLINIGDYEQIQMFLSFSSSVQASDNSRVPTIKIHAKESAEVSGQLEEAAETLKTKVRAVLDKEEKLIRKWSDAFTSFDTLDKLPKKRKF